MMRICDRCGDGLQAIEGVTTTNEAGRCRLGDYSAVLCDDCANEWTVFILGHPLAEQFEQSRASEVHLAHQTATPENRQLLAATVSETLKLRHKHFQLAAGFVRAGKPIEDTGADDDLQRNFDHLRECAEMAVSVLSAPFVAPKDIAHAVGLLRNALAETEPPKPDPEGSHA